MNACPGEPLLGCHADMARLAAVRELYLNTDRWAGLRRAVRRLLAHNNPLAGLRPGGTPWRQVSGYAPGHGAALLAAMHLIEPAAATAEPLKNLLLWSLEQESLILGSGLAVGQFCRGLVLALDAVGGELPAADCRAVLEHLVLCCVENPDADDIMNHHPAGMPPLVDYLAFPGTGFHLLDEQVNNWDVISAMALVYIVRAMAVLHPGRQAEMNRWLELAGRRLERFFRLCFSAQGEYSEGPGYYSYGCMAAVSVLDALGRWPEGRRLVDTFDLRGLEASPDWCREMFHGAPRHGHFNFNDSMRWRAENPAVIHWLAARTRNPEAQYFAGQLLELEESTPAGENQPLESRIFSCLWRDPALEPRAPRGRRAIWFGRCGSAVVRTGYADADLHLLLRAGDHVGAHTHPSHGNLLLSMGGADLLSDAGMPADRTIPAYRSYHCCTKAHNCLLIDGLGQVLERGGSYQKARITRFADNGRGVYIRADCSAVYPNAETVVRDVYCSWNGWILQHDRVRGDCRRMTVMLHTAPADGTALVAIAPDRMTIRQAAAWLRVLFVKGIDAAEDAGTEYHESDPAGQHAIHLHCDKLDAVLLFLPCLSGAPEPAATVVATPEGWEVTVNHVRELVSFGAPDNADAG